jgi:VCBS repeat-containing protein
MPDNTSGGTTTSFNNTPQAKDDLFFAEEDMIHTFDVMANDLGGKAKVLWSIDDTSDDGSADLIAKDVAGVVEYSELGAKIWLENGLIKYDTSSLDWLAAGETATDQFTYAIRLSNGTLSWATVTIIITGTNDDPTITGALDSGAVTEDDATPTLSDSGTIDFADVDLADGHTVSATPQAGGYLGTFSVSVTDPSTGDGSGQVSWSFEVDNAAVQYLAEGEALTQTYTVEIDDGQGGTVTQDVTVTITGTNDDPPPFVYSTPAIFTGTGDPNDFDHLGNAAGQTINGTNADNTLYGGAGNDTIHGDNGNDVIYGGSGADMLNGNNHVDHLYGGSGNDTVNGDNQADHIYGGFGADLLTGGSSNDTFYFLDQRDTGDTITDFASGDKIDLTALGVTGIAGELTQAGAVGAGQVGWITAAGVTTIYVDTDGSFGADLEITLQNGYALSGADFII